MCLFRLLLHKCDDKSRKRIKLSKLGNNYFRRQVVYGSSNSNNIHNPCFGFHFDLNAYLVLSHSYRSISMCTTFMNYLKCVCKYSPINSFGNNNFICLCRIDNEQITFKFVVLSSLHIDLKAGALTLF